MSSFTITILSIALMFVGSTITSMSPATSPATSVNVPTQSPSSVSPSPSLPVVEPPPASLLSPANNFDSPPYNQASPSPAMMSTALPPYDGAAPAPAPNGAILDRVMTVCFLSSCFISISFLLMLST
ncbi:hypothetical protein QVD17_26730 [Tagetes erecta]|uniref:Uncharacterized protein n=1 Tax=Tagetes erecta TaxID=13708 RepID=A0AAD8NIU1_TARER|nr:hypothetical protein QVD17_26730 [Tagetes erecta]